MSDAEESEFATIAVVWEGGQHRLVVRGQSMQAVRTIPTIRLLQDFCGDSAFLDGMREVAGARRSVCFVQYFDLALNQIRSVAFCRKLTTSRSVALIPDTYFFEHRGYNRIRARAQGRELPPWRDRKPVVFWRGSPTVDWALDSGRTLSEIPQIPRVRLCLDLKALGWADAAVSGTWGDRFDRAEQTNFFKTNGIFQPFIGMAEHAQYRYLIDIDGVGNAWSLFEKLLLGSTVIKIDSRYEQWFYGEIEPWRHFVPVRQDLGDLLEKLRWCADHPDAAAAIAAAGQRFALSWSLADARRFAIRQMLDSFLHL